MAARRKKSDLDHQIEAFYYKYSQGLQINVLDIGKVFAAGRNAATAGQDVEQAVKNAVATYCRPV